MVNFVDVIYSCFNSDKLLPPYELRLPNLLYWIVNGERRIFPNGNILFTQKSLKSTQLSRKDWLKVVFWLLTCYA